MNKTFFSLFTKISIKNLQKKLAKYRKSLIMKVYTFYICKVGAWFFCPLQE